MKFRLISAFLILLIAAAVQVPRRGQASDLVEYGKHLSEQCTSCHQTVSCEGGIPPLGHLPVDYFVLSMKRFEAGRRQNEVMASIASSLSAEDVQALANFYASLQEPEC